MKRQLLNLETHNCTCTWLWSHKDSLRHMMNSLLRGWLPLQLQTTPNLRIPQENSQPSFSSFEDERNRSSKTITRKNLKRETRQTNCLSWPVSEEGEVNKEERAKPPLLTAKSLDFEEMRSSREETSLRNYFLRQSINSQQHSQVKPSSKPWDGSSPRLISKLR